MTTRRPIIKLAYHILDQLGDITNKDTVNSLADLIQDWLDEDQADYILKEDTNYYVCKLYSTNAHPPNPVVEKGMGFSFLKKGDAFDFSKKDFYHAEGQGRIYQATSDFRNGRICAVERYNPEV